MTKTKLLNPLISLLLFVIIHSQILYAQNNKLENRHPEIYENSAGIKMLPVEDGKFIMGGGSSRDYWDQSPAHEVTISKPFYISETEITVEQYKLFDPGYNLDGQFGSFATGISWYDAAEFCKWLSEKEGIPYRLPTEAEWEYVCRAGSTTLYASGETEPPHGWANQWGVKNMHSGVREWCYDWYGDYSAAAQTDPIGAEHGIARVVRGGSIDHNRGFYSRKIFNSSSSRASMAPSYGIVKKPASNSQASSDSKSSKTFYEKGLTGTYFAEHDLTRPQNEMTLYSLDQVWENQKSLGQGWSAKWYGWIESPCSGEVTFHMSASTGAILNIDGKKLIDLWGKEGSSASKITMVENRKYPLELIYHRNRGGSYLKVLWSWDGREPQAVPEEYLFHTPEDISKAEQDKQSAALFGSGWIGFRVVQAQMPQTTPTPAVRSYATQGVRENAGLVKISPDMAKPYFRKRYLLPIPLDNSSIEEIDAVNMHPSFRMHNHSPALEVCPNGDILMIIYTSYNEYEPGVTLIASRLRFGEEQWDMPDRMFGFASANNHAPMLWTDKENLHFFWGSPIFDGAFPFQWTSSYDSGGTWDEIKFPGFEGKVGGHSRQPINSAFRDNTGTIFVASDGIGAASLLWASGDNGKTWYDTQGRSAGRHTTYALLNDGKSILGMGGKNSDIDGYMPQVLSRDSGKTWQITKSQFPALGGNQRPSLLRLKSGRLFFAGDYQDFHGKKPENIKENGSFAALSDDDGKTWTVKTLIGTEQHKVPTCMGGHSTLGYSAARQAPNGMIHLITSLNRPCLHFELNEAWILSDDNGDAVSNEILMSSSASSISDIKQYKETYNNGRVKVIFSGGIADDGRFLLDGKQIWYYPDGSKQRKALYRLGNKIGKEKYWREDGTIKWQRKYLENGKSIWTQYFQNGQINSKSEWKNFKCHGSAQIWDQNGKLLGRKEFIEGRIKN
jgi:hypothetical protein